MRGKLIGKKWIYLERNTLHRVGPYQERGWIISLANEWEDYSNYLGEGWRFSGIGSPHTSLSLRVGLRTVMELLSMSFNFLICYTEPILRIKVSSKLTCLPSWTHWTIISLCWVLILSKVVPCSSTSSLLPNLIFH